MKKLIVANWKENPETERRARELFLETVKARRAPGVELVVAPPFIYLEEVAAAFRKLSLTKKRGLSLGAQDVFWEEMGHYTGEVGPKMVKSLGVRYVIVGHSERRKYFRETDAMVNKKLMTALKDGLCVILCVGEPAAVRKKGVATAKKFIKNQLKAGLAGLRGKRPAGAEKGELIVAYEPIWAIGNGKSDNPGDAGAMVEFIRREASGIAPRLAVKILYGGSVNSGNVKDFVQYKGIDGALVGGASLDANEFVKMLKIN